jgi:hypothetical protein
MQEVCYNKEDDYSNDNYVSDGLSNEELIEKVNELITVAKKELIKSGEKQYTISGSILNFLMVTDEFGNRVFENFFNDFALGNFIKAKIDKKLYDIRLSDVTINYSDITKFDVTFSDAYRIGSPTVNTVKDILSKAQSMSTSYSSVKKQASQGANADKNFDKMLNEGLDSALYNIKNSNSTIVFDEHGLLARSWNDENNDYSPEQCRLSNNEIIYTSDNWKTAETAIGKQKYTLNGITYEEYCVNTKLLLSGKVISGDIYSLNYATDENGVVTSGTHIDLNNGDFVFAGGKLSYLNNELSVKGNISAIGGDIGGWLINDKGISSVFEDNHNSNIYSVSLNKIWSDNNTVIEINKNNEPQFFVRSNGFMYAANANITGSIVNGSIRTNGRTSLSEDKLGFYVGNDGFDLCWLGRDEFMDDLDVYAHLRATSKAFEIIVGDTVVLSVPIRSRFSGTNVGYHVETSTLCSKKIYYSDTLEDTDIGGK